MPAIAGAAVPISSHPIGKARAAMQRATEVFQRLQDYRTAMLGEDPPNPDSVREQPGYGGELGSLEDMAIALDLFSEDASRTLSRLEAATISKG